MNIGNHRSDIASTVRSFGRVRILDGLEICVNGRIKVHGISFVERVNLAARRDLNLIERDQNEG